jgi:hypothetical protein
MSLTNQRLLAASALLTASLGACVSRQVPAAYPASSAASADARQASPAELNQAFQNDAPNPSGGSDPAGPPNSAQPQQEHQHGHHH